MRKLTFFTCLLLLLTCVAALYANKDESEALVNEAWVAWGKNNLSLVEQKLTEALTKDEQNSRAHFAFSFLYAYRRNFEASWRSFEKALESEKDDFPYLFATWSRQKFTENFTNSNSSALKILKSLAEHGDPSGTLKSMANHELGEYFIARGKLKTAKEYFQAMNTMNDWLLIGPFDNTSASGYENVFPPEMEFDATKEYEGKNGVPARWFEITAIRDNYWIDFRRYFAYRQSVYYANAFVLSPQKQTVQIRVGTSGSLKTFLNDEPVIEIFDENNNDMDTYIVETELQEGWNRLMIKCGYSEISQCNFMARITDAAGMPIPGLQVSTERQKYQSKPDAPIKTVENFAEAFFKQKIEANPGHLENYIFLSDAYLRNDKAIEAELVLKKALKRSPDNALLLERILEAFLRGEKDDKGVTTLEKIHTLEPDNITALEYKINVAFENDDTDGAEALIGKIDKQLPNSPTSYQLYIRLYAQKKEIEKMLQILDMAYAKYPEYWTFATTKAVLDIKMKNRYETAIGIFKNYLKHDYSSTALTTLAAIYLQASNLKKWREMYDKALEIDPAATGYYSKMASTYLLRQDYANAESAIRKAIDVCPNSASYWASLGEIYRMSGRTVEAKSTYAEALRFQPTNYDVREKLRELNNQKPVFSHFDEPDIKESMQAAPDAEQYPKDGAIYLLKDVRRVVYEQGASETRNEILVKIFNKKGIDDFKEYWVSYNSYSQGLTIEKAIVIKPNGTEIKGDVSYSRVVFKSLEENDFIYVKWKTKNYYSGRLSNHFWDDFYFNRYYPVKYARYALLAPDKVKFQSRTQNMPDAPVKTSTDDGTIYEWVVTDEPAVDYEYGMPGLQDIGKILYVSTIEDWAYLVDWYADLAQTKARGAYEIEEQVNALFEGKNGLSNDEKVKTIYDFITDNIRYSSVDFRQSGLIPQKARDVLVSRIGDCKDVATLCISMLREAGITAHYVLVNTIDEGRNENILPSISFNHCIVGVETSNGLQYLDLTAENYPAGSAPYVDINSFSLLIRPGVKAPNYLSPDNFMPSNIVRLSKIEVRDDNSIFVQNECVKTGALGAWMRGAYRHAAQEDREKGLLESLNQDHADVKLLKFEIDDIDALSDSVHYRYAFEINNGVKKLASLRYFEVPWSDALNPSDAFAYEKREYPIWSWKWGDKRIQEMEIRLPAGYEPGELPENVKIESAIGSYSLELAYQNGVLKAKRMLIVKKRQVLPEEYLEAKKFYNTVVEADETHIVMEKSD